MVLYVLKKTQGRTYDSEDLLRKILLLCGTADASVCREESGRLSVRTKDGTAALYVSVSHTAKYWVCLTDSLGPVGVDIEEKSRKIRPNTLRILHPLEQAYLSGLEEGSPDWNGAFLDLWTRKESYVKYLGSGLSHGMSCFSVIDEKGEPAGLIRDKAGLPAYLQSLAVSDGLWAAVCADHPPETLTVRHFRDPGKPVKSPEEQAVDFLSRRDYTAGELTDKLIRKGHDPRSAEIAVAQLQESGYLDDGQFAEQYARHALRQGRGKYRIVQELLRKGVEAETARAAAETVLRDAGEGEFDRALRQARLLLARSGQLSDDPLSNKMRGRIARRLSALGYESSVIYEILESLRP